MRTWLRAISYIILVLFILAEVALLSVSYTAALFLLCGFVVAQLLIFLAPRIFPYIIELDTWIIVLILAVLCFLCLLPFRKILIHLTPMAGGCNLPQTTSDKVFTGYHAIIEPVDFSKGVFKISEEATYNVENYECNSSHTFIKSSVQEGLFLSPAEKRVNSLSRGLLLRELRVVPLDGSAISGVDSFDLISSTVELRDIPRNSFYEARDVEKAEVSKYLDTETVKWNDLSLSGGILFAYIAPPFYLLRSLVSPLIGIFYQGQWWIVLIGLIVTSVITPLVKSVFIDLVKDKFKSLFKGKPPKKDGKKNNSRSIKPSDGKKTKGKPK